MKASVIITTYNHLDYLKPLIDSIITYTDLDNIEVGIITNGCKDGTKEYLEELVKSDTVRYPNGNPFWFTWFNYPIGATCAMNEGIKLASGEFVIILNNDTVLLPQEKNTWINMLLSPFSDPKVGITGPLKLDWPGIHENNREFIVFFCAAVRKSLFKELGLFDEIFNPGAGEDTDFCFKALERGYKLVQVPGPAQRGDVFMMGAFPIYHRGAVTVNQLSTWSEVEKRNTNVLMERYNGKVVHSG